MRFSESARSISSPGGSGLNELGKKCELGKKVGRRSFGMEFGVLEGLGGCGVA